MSASVVARLAIGISCLAVCACGAAPDLPEDGNAQASAALGADSFESMPYYAIVIDGVERPAFVMPDDGTGMTTVRVPMGTPVRDWITSSLDMSYQRKSGELKAADFKRQVRHIREFKDALITQITFPASDAASTDYTFLQLRFSPWLVRNKPGDGSTVENPTDVKQKTFHPTNFRFTIDGLPPADKKVAKVDALTIKQTGVVDDTGGARDYLKEPGKIDFPNLKLVIDEQYRPAFDAWLAAQSSGQDDRRHGRIVYQDSAVTGDLVTVDFESLGVFRMAQGDETTAQDPADGGAASTRFTVELSYASASVKYETADPNAVIQ